MKRFFAITAVMLLLMGVATAFAEKPVICNFQGSWLGYDQDGNAVILSTINGQSFSNGTVVVQIPGYDLSQLNFYGIGTTGRGNWIRTGFNTFAVTFTGMAVDPEYGHTLGIVKVDTTNTLGDDCNSNEIEGTISIFLNPKANPFLDEPDWGPYPLTPHGAIRMVVTPLD